MRQSLFAIVLGALTVAGAQPVWASGGVDVNQLTFNSSLIIQMINSHGNYDPGKAVGILTAQVTNNGADIPAGGGSGIPFVLTVTEQGNPAQDCSSNGGTDVTVTGLYTAKLDGLKHGQMVSLLASDFTSSNPAVSLCQAFTSDLETQFKSANPSDLGNQVQQLLSRHFSVCLSAGGVQACTQISIFNPPAATVSTSAALILPMDRANVGANPVFVWTPANNRGDSSGIDYTLVISQSSGGDPWSVINTLPTGQTYYQWNGTPVLVPGTYYWHVVSKLHSNGQTVGGQNGNGWSVTRSFTVGGTNETGGAGAGPCAYQLADLDKLVQSQPDAKSALAGFTLNGILPSSLNNPDLCALLASPQTRLVGVTVTKR